MKGRKKKPHVTPWNEAIPGLTRCGDGRWRVDLGNRKEVRFTEAEESTAVARAKKLLRMDEHAGTTAVERLMAKKRDKKSDRYRAILRELDVLEGSVIEDEALERLGERKRAKGESISDLLSLRLKNQNQLDAKIDRIEKKLDR